MAFRHIRSIISEASADQTLYTVPSGKEFMLLRTRARYEGGSSSGDGSGDIIASNGTVIFARVNGAFNRAGTTTVHGVTAPYYSRIVDSSASYYVTRVYSIAHLSVMWIITSYDASVTAENWVEDEGFSAMAYATSTETSPVGLTFESEHGTPPTFSLGDNSSGGSSVEGNVSVSFKVNSGNAFETIDIDHNTVANGRTWMTLCEAGSVIRANSTNADAMAEIMGIELKAGSWESVGGNGGGGGSSSSSSEESSSSSSGSGGGSPSGMYLRVTSSETVGGCAQLYSLTEGDPSMTPFYDTNPLNYHGVTSGGWVITIVYRDVKSIVDFYVANQNIPQTYHAGISDYQWQSLADAISRIKVWNDEEKGGTINMTLTLE